MFRIQVGQPRAGKTKAVKDMIKNSTDKKLIFDFNDDFTDVKGTVVDLEMYHPLVDDITLEEAKIINAGYLNSSRCLYRKVEEIFQQDGAIPNVIQCAIDRLSFSLNDKWGEAEYARILAERIPKKIPNKHQSLDEIVKLLREHDTVIVKAKNIHSDHLRTMMYFLIYKVSLCQDLKVKIIADEISTLFFKGNLKLLFEVIELGDIDIILSSNRPSNIPKIIKGVVDEWSLFKNTDKSEVRYLHNHFGIGLATDIAAIPLEKYIVEKSKKVETRC